MKCPYAVNRRTVSQTMFEYNEEGVQTFQQTVENNTASSRIVWGVNAVRGRTAAASTAAITEI